MEEGGGVCFPDESNTQFIPVLMTCVESLWTSGIVISLIFSFPSLYLIEGNEGC